MMALVLATFFIIAAYLIGSIPFAYLIVRWRKGIDVRTVGSGNVGATNAARVLGLRYFFIIFALDLLKGALPTWGLPAVMRWTTGAAPPWLGVLVALAAILGHNYPIYLRFRGGKGVATSLGALAALEPWASGAAALGFVVFLLVTKYVSLSSLLGGLVFALVHFTRRVNPWDRDHRALSALTIGLLGMLIVRHRKNLARIWTGTEPKVTFRRRRKPPRGGSKVIVVIALAIVGALGAAVVVARVRTPERLDCGPFELVTRDRVGTGHQRAERLTFNRTGELLAVTCPRYDRLVLYRVTTDETLETVADVRLAGQPVAVRAVGDRFVVLERPSGDARHVEAGFWEELDGRGRIIEGRTPVGFYPDDMALTADGRWAFVLSSGRAEGDEDRPKPALVVYRRLVGEAPRIVGRLDFEGSKDDPERLALGSTGKLAAVTLRGSEEVALVDLSDREHPKLVRRSPLEDRPAPYLTAIGDELLMMPTRAATETVVVPWPTRTRIESTSDGPYRVETRPTSSALFVARAGDPIGLLSIHGPGGLGGIRPTGLAVAPGRPWLAVADRSGGVHLIAIRARRGEGAAGGPIPASDRKHSSRP